MRTRAGCAVARAPGDTACRALGRAYGALARAAMRVYGLDREKQRKAEKSKAPITTLVEMAGFEEAAPKVVLTHLVRNHSLVHRHEVGILRHELVDGSRVESIHLRCPCGAFARFRRPARLPPLATSFPLLLAAASTAMAGAVYRTS